MTHVLHYLHVISDFSVLTQDGVLGIALPWCHREGREPGQSDAQRTQKTR